MGGDVPSSSGRQEASAAADASRQKHQQDLQQRGRAAGGQAACGGTTGVGSPTRQQLQQRRAQQPCSQVPSLHSLAAASLVAHIDRVASLQGLPEELVLSLFEAVLAQGRLTPRVLGLFEATGHELLAARVAQLGISSWTPPLIDTKDRWLGSRPAWL